MFIKEEINNYICTLKIKREDALNAVNPAVLKELHHEVEIAKDSKDVSVIIITGSGEKSFIAGADIKALSPAPVRIITPIF